MRNHEPPNRLLKHENSRNSEQGAGLTSAIKNGAGLVTVASAIMVFSGGPSTTPAAAPAGFLQSTPSSDAVARVLRRRSEETLEGGSQSYLSRVQETGSGRGNIGEPLAFRVASDNTGMSNTPRENFAQPFPPSSIEEPRQATRADFPDFEPISTAEAYDRAMALLTKADLAHARYLEEEALHAPVWSDVE